MRQDRPSVKTKVLESEIELLRNSIENEKHVSNENEKHMSNENEKCAKHIIDMRVSNEM